MLLLGNLRSFVWEQGGEPGQEVLYALQSLEHHFEPEGPDPLGEATRGHSFHHNEIIKNGSVPKVQTVKGMMIMMIMKMF